MIEVFSELCDTGFVIKSRSVDGAGFQSVWTRWSASSDAGERDWGVVETAHVSREGISVELGWKPTVVDVFPIRNRTVAPLADLTRSIPAGVYEAKISTWTPPGVIRPDEISVSVGAAGWKTEVFSASSSNERSTKIEISKEWKWVETRKARGSSGSRVVFLQFEDADGKKFGLARGCSRAFHDGLSETDSGILEFSEKAEPWSYFKSTLVEF